MLISGTEKIYYRDMLQKRCTATVETIDENRVVLDRTVAFPEGGGQEGDRGSIVLAGGDTARFQDTTKSLGRRLYLSDFPIINVDTKIIHHVEDADRERLAQVKVGDVVDVLIDAQRRERLTTSHTASHILYMAIELVRPGVVENIFGCHIKEDAARFDFALGERFSADDVFNIEAASNEIIAKNYPIELYHHENEDEAWYWKCNGVVIPCGGTHLPSTGSVVKMEVGRKSLGKGKERLRCSFPDALIDLTKYVD